MFTLYIPDNVLPTDTEIIKETFHKLNLAKVRDVEFAPHMECEYNTEPCLYGGAYVYIDYWYNNISADHLVERIKDLDQDARIVYDDPDYWVLEPCHDDTEKMLSTINMNIDQSQESLRNLYAHLTNNITSVNYLLDQNRKEWMRKNRIAKRQTNFKAQQRWKRRLRPRFGYSRRTSLFAP